MNSKKTEQPHLPVPGRIKCLIFDIGNVLVFFDNNKMMEGLGNLLGEDPASLHARLFDQEWHRKFELGLVAFEDIFASFIHYRPELVGRLQDAFNQIFTPHQQMLDLLPQLGKNGFRIVLLSNTNYLHFQYLSRVFAIDEHVNASILSYQIEAAKPQAEIFNLAMQVAGVRGDQCLYTDDIAEFVGAARLTGLRAVNFSDSEAYLNDLQSIQ